MTDQEINIAIAEVRGWDFDPFEAHERGSRGRWCKSPEGEMFFRHHAPNYCNDLNAMHEAEKILEPNQAGQMMTHLSDLLYETWKRSDYWGEWLRIHATARQRAEAFLRTLGKWKEAS